MEREVARQRSIGGRGDRSDSPSRSDYIRIPADYLETNGKVPGELAIGSGPYAATNNGDVREVGLLEGLQQRSAAMEQSKRGLG